MHGIVHRSIKQYVIERDGHDSWQTVADRAGLDGGVYLAISDYPDREVTAAFEALSDLTGHPASVVKRDFGRYFAPHMLRTFDALLTPEDDGMDALATLDQFFERIARKEGPAESVDVATHRPDPDTVVVEYSSERPLSAMLEGIAEGIADEYDLAADVECDSDPGADLDCVVTVTRGE